MLRTAPLRVLDDADVPAVLALLDADPVAGVMVASRIETAGLDPWRLGAEVWGYSEDGRLSGICYAGANLVPVCGSPSAVHAFAEKARRQGRRCSSIVGPRHLVAPLWHQVSRSWGPARQVRDHQPVMVTDRPSRVPADPGVRRVNPDEIDVLLPACIAMFTEEIGVSPIAGDGGALYRSRVGELIAAGRSFARIEGRQVVFKAEIGPVTRAACQVQGVWVDPAYRGRGHSVAGMAAVVDEALRTIAPLVTLYVNDFNLPARRAYERVGFRSVGEFMSVLF